MNGRLALGFGLTRALGSIFIDRVEEAFGRALPRTREQLVGSGVVDSLLNEASPLDGRELPGISGTRLSGVDFESSNCTNFLIDLEFDEAECGETALPKTAYAKLPCGEVGTRAFANAVGFWDTELTFCRSIASRVPIRVPKVYAAARRGARFVLLLENLHEVEGSRLFINRDMAAGTTPERARMCIKTFAELHAAFSGLGEGEREAIFPIRLHTYLAPGGSEKSRALNASAIAPAHKAAPDIFTATHVDLCNRAIEKWDLLMEAWYSGPLTLIHGDSHLANCFEYPTPDGPQMGMIDFQGMQWCKGIRDVQYFLINSLSPEVLKQHEEELIDYYISALAENGIALGRDDAVSQYRGYAFQTLMVAVVSIGLGSLTERQETVRTVLERSVAAIDRLGFDEWLSAL